MAHDRRWAVEHHFANAAGRFQQPEALQFEITGDLIVAVNRSGKNWRLDMIPAGRSS
jgi:hypothetical protein